jgi:hypothetical protein
MKSIKSTFALLLAAFLFSSCNFGAVLRGTDDAVKSIRKVRFHKITKLFTKRPSTSTKKVVKQRKPLNKDYWVKPGTIKQESSSKKETSWEDICRRFNIDRKRMEEELATYLRDNATDIPGSIEQVKEDFEKWYEEKENAQLNKS